MSRGEHKSAQVNRSAPEFSVIEVISDHPYIDSRRSELQSAIGSVSQWHSQDREGGAGNE